MPNYNNVPLMFRSQLPGRCQIQRLVPGANVQDAENWADEWVEELEEKDYQFRDNVETREYQFTWRFITNSGQDEGVIRPVIGAKGFPYFPGSSMKGAFWRSCPKDKRALYCGYEKDGESHAGILRFHGGYPDKEWMFEELVDVVHPQEDWQVKNGGNHSAFIQISLYKPKFTFGITSKKPLSDGAWNEIWQIWEGAIAQGLGTRVSAGYGQVKLTNRHELNSLLTVNLKGKGLASQLINKKGEFRANMFKAALRGHTLRLLGGVTDANTAEAITKQLWGGFAGRNGAVVGELGIVFDAIDLELDDFTYTPARRPFDMPIYQLNHGKLDILSMKNISTARQNNLKKFLKKLLQFSLFIGGFGKSWRRIDHRLFYPDYLENGRKPMIGCHWEFIKPSTGLFITVNELEDLTKFLNSVHSNMKGWVTYNKKQLNPQGANWRETFKKGNVQVWGRIAENKLDSEAIDFFHGQYQRDKTIKQSTLTGRMGRIGRIIHRMYPRRIKREDNKILVTKQYVELLTIFPDDSQKTREFIQYLRSNVSDFKQLW
ncbi:hypothetical protein IQ215_03530 [Cyanobacterium stanieri LEGE 03274]|uniref:RAMP superfamily protein n=1 Tax=Cyanobacterium stanieri LEGE 03274 TaxID=1828756 RepID=A0ABR9V1I6_9CHRO|nr:hypothetical protein [Cyanobacterium stanieri]MBE9221759.1 hypothetical protein [Cyanobacterium stanieri LEGE 03274]